MGDWKDDKNLGPSPWRFVEQPNKWGYLNNPRWTAAPGPPVNYNDTVWASELREPQIWTPNRGSTLPTKVDSAEHDPCGHWHKFPIPPEFARYTFELYWELINNQVSHPSFENDGGVGYVLSSVSFITMNPDDFDGDVEWYFEAAAHNESGNDVTIQVVTEDDLNVCAEIEFENGLTGIYGRETYRRRVAMTPNGVGEYGIRLLSGGNVLSWPLTFWLYTARIVIKQVGASKTHLQIPMLGSGWSYVFLEYAAGGRLPYDHPIGHSIYKSGSDPLDDWTSDYGSTSTHRLSQGNTTIFKFDPSEVNQLENATFTVFAKPWYSSEAAAYDEIQYYSASVPVMEYDLVMYWAPAGSPTGACLSGNPPGWVDENTVHTDDCTGTVFTPIPDSYWQANPFVLGTWSKAVDLSAFDNWGGTVRIFIGGQVNAGVWGHFNRWFDLYIPSGVGLRNVTLNINHTASNQWNWSLEWSRVLSAGFNDLEVALREVNSELIVPGSILKWEDNEEMSRKYATISLGSGEYETVVRCIGSIFVSGVGSTPEIMDSQLWMKVNPIRSLHVWYRCMHNYFSAPDNQIVPAGWDYTSIVSKMLYNRPIGFQTAYFEATAYLLYAGSNNKIHLRNMGVDDETGAGGSDAATLEFDVVGQRQRKRVVVSSLYDGNRYCDRQPYNYNDVGYVWANNGFIILEIGPDNSIEI
jgi:hypothetical protein